MHSRGDSAASFKECVIGVSRGTIRGMSAFDAIVHVFKGITAIIALLKQAKDLLPDGEEKKTVEQSLEEVERKSKLAEAQIAKALGHRLCQCTFPPQIMLKTGYSRAHGDHFQCPNGHTWPSQEDSGEAEFVQDFEP